MHFLNNTFAGRLDHCEWNKKWKALVCLFVEFRPWAFKVNKELCRVIIDGNKRQRQWERGKRFEGIMWKRCKRKKGVKWSVKEQWRQTAVVVWGSQKTVTITAFGDTEAGSVNHLQVKLGIHNMNITCIIITKHAKTNIRTNDFVKKCAGNRKQYQG